MKIVQVSAYFHPHTGGSERYCHGLSRHLAERGHEVHVVTSMLNPEMPSYEEKDGLRVHRCPCVGVMLGVNPATFIMHKLIKMKADVIHAHSYVFLTSNQAALARKLIRTPLLLHLHGGIEFTPPANDFLTQLKFYLKKSVYDHTLGKWTVETANAVASVSKRDIELAKKLWDLNREKLHWIPNAVDLDKFGANNCSERLSVVFIGRLEPWKGIGLFLKVAGLVLKERRDVDFLMWEMEALGSTLRTISSIITLSF